MALELINSSLTEALRGFKHQCEVGLPITDSLHLSATICKNSGDKKAFLRACEKAKAGATIENIFDSLTPLSEAERSVMVAGWKGGKLPTVLDMLIHQREVWTKVQREMKAQLVLPFMILFAAAFVAPFPKFMLEGKILPYLVSSAMPLIIMGIAGLLLYQFLKSRHHARLSHGPHAQPKKADWLDKLMLGLPLIQSVERNRNLSRFSLTLANLHGAGVPHISALEQCARILPNGIYRDDVQKCLNHVRPGNPLSSALTRHDLWPQEYVAALAIAEKTGKEDEILKRLGEQFIEKYSQAIKALGSWLPRFVYVLICIYIIHSIFTGLFVKTYLKMDLPP